MKIARTPLTLAAAGALMLGSPAAAMADTEQATESSDVVETKALDTDPTSEIDEPDGEGTEKNSPAEHVATGSEDIATESEPLVVESENPEHRADEAEVDAAPEVVEAEPKNPDSASELEPSLTEDVVDESVPAETEAPAEQETPDVSDEIAELETASEEDPESELEEEVLPAEPKPTPKQEATEKDGSNDEIVGFGSGVSNVDYVNMTATVTIRNGNNSEYESFIIRSFGQDDLSYIDDYQFDLETDKIEYTGVHHVNVGDTEEIVVPLFLSDNGGWQIWDGYNDGELLLNFSYGNIADDQSEDAPNDIEVDFYEPERSLRNPNEVLVFRDPGLEFTWNENATSSFNGFEDVVDIPEGETLTVTVSAKEGYTLPEGTKTEWSFEYIAGVDEDDEDEDFVVVTPEEPTRDGNTISIPDIDGVDYGYESGEVAIPKDEPLTVDANPLYGYKFPNDLLKMEWIYHYDQDEHAEPGAHGQTGSGNSDDEQDIDDEPSNSEETPDGDDGGPAGDGVSDAEADEGQPDPTDSNESPNPGDVDHETSDGEGASNEEDAPAGDEAPDAEADEGQPDTTDSNESPNPGDVDQKASGGGDSAGDSSYGDDSSGNSSATSSSVAPASDDSEVVSGREVTDAVLETSDAAAGSDKAHNTESGTEASTHTQHSDPEGASAAHSTELAKTGFSAGWTALGSLLLVLLGLAAAWPARRRRQV